MNSFWFVLIAAFAAGCVIGAVLYGALSHGTRDARKLKSDLEKSEAEFEAYKSSVSSHFSKTSELVNDLTQDYVKVYKHLAEGAQILGDPSGGMDLLEQQDKVLLSVADTPAVDHISSAENEQPAQPDEPEQEQIAGEGAQQEPGFIDDDSRDYISETIREAADIAGKIDEEKEPASPHAEAADDPEKTEESAEEKKRKS
ncbi:DUF1043 family protein [Gammaproteobacteria bacterium]|nr:DUF1043 family protein [Gammaproteobacteria bacterium]